MREITIDGTQLAMEWRKSTTTNSAKSGRPWNGYIARPAARAASCESSFVPTITEMTPGRLSTTLWLSASTA